VDADSGLKFFKVKNSWGEGGDSPNEFGTCAVLAYMTAPIVV
jgi:hypothetical protein